MADYKLVNTVQLDADLSSIADAIRNKTGNSEPLVFPAAFIEAIGNISGGGESIVGEIDYYCFPSSWISPEMFSSHRGSEIRQITASNLDDSFHVGCGEDNDWYIYAYSEGLTTITMELNSGDIETYVFCCIDTDHLTLNSDYSRTAFTIDEDYSYQTISSLRWHDWLNTSLNRNGDFADSYNYNEGRWCVFYQGVPIYTMSGDLVDEDDYMNQTKYTTILPIPDSVDGEYDVTVTLGETVNPDFMPDSSLEGDWTTVRKVLYTENNIATVHDGHDYELEIEGKKLGSTEAYVFIDNGQVFKFNITVRAGDYTDTYDVTFNKDPDGNCFCLTLDIPPYNSIQSTTYTNNSIAYIEAYSPDKLEIYGYNIGSTVATVTFDNGITITVNITVKPGLLTKPLYDRSNVLNAIYINYEEGTTWAEWISSEYNTSGFVANLTNRQGTIIPIGIEIDEIVYGVVSCPYNATSEVTSLESVFSEDWGYHLEPLTNYIPAKYTTTSKALIGYGEQTLKDHDNSSIEFYEPVIYSFDDPHQEIVTIRVDYDPEFTTSRFYITPLKVGFVNMYVTKTNSGETYKISIFSRCSYIESFNVTLNAGATRTLGDGYVLMITGSNYVTYTVDGIASVELIEGTNTINVIGLDAGKTRATAVGYVNWQGGENDSACYYIDIEVIANKTETVVLSADQTSVTLFADKNYNSVTLTGIDGLTDNINTIISNDGKLTINYEVNTDTEITVHCTVA